MKKLLLTGTALGGLIFATAALAADLPVKAPVYKAPVAPLYSWTGFYIGGNVGYSWGKADNTYYFPDNANFDQPTTASDSVKPKGVIGGGQIGYNWQASPNWIFGLEADFQGSGQKASADGVTDFTIVTGPVEFPDTTTGTVAFGHEEKLTWFGTVRGRIGYAFVPNTMLYATGGLAYGHVSTAANLTVVSATNGVPNPTLTSSFNGSDTNVGWTVGAGVEGALFASPNWTWKVEYLYLDLGSVTYNFNDANFGAVSITSKVTDNIVRAGVNYRF